MIQNPKIQQMKNPENLLEQLNFEQKTEHLQQTLRKLTKSVKISNDSLD